MLRKTGLGLVSAVLGAALLAGCGSARVVTRNQYGGVIALQGDRGKAMEQAHKEMSAHCGPSNYQITQEGEEVIGQDTFHNSDTSYGEDTAYGEGTTTSGNSSATAGGSSTRGGSSTSATTSTRNAVEWRVHYQCGGAPGPTGAPVGGPPPPPPPPPGG
ncbi:MAG TPA: hypothetical protein VM734_36550 [Kofleriaceae bacterium]|nr:hypothetical protein [Kofleriaceae bacterium]